MRGIRDLCAILRWPCLVTITFNDHILEYWAATSSFLLLLENLISLGFDSIIVVTMKAFDICELKKTARVKELEVNRSYSEIHKSPLRQSIQ